MKSVVLALMALLIMGCEEAPKETATRKVEAPSVVWPPVATVTPGPPPSPSPAPEPKPFLSSWTRNDGKYSVDLSGMKNDDPYGGILVTEGVAYFVFGGSPGCPAKVSIYGSNDNGTMVITGADLCGRYESYLEGNYNYVAYGDGYRLDKAGFFFLWE